jgi:hypothetical protein
VGLGFLISGSPGRTAVRTFHLHCYLNIGVALFFLSRKLNILKRPPLSYAFSSEDLKKLFHSREFLEDKHRHSYCFWLPIIALFTGMRLNEICQLHLNDFRSEDGIYVIDVIGDEKEKNLKNKTSRRLVPLHNFLVLYSNPKRKLFIKKIKSLKKEGKGVANIFKAPQKPSFLCERSGGQKIIMKKMLIVLLIIFLSSCATTPDIHLKIPGTNMEINRQAELAERLAVSPKNNFILVGSMRHASALWDITTGQKLKSLKPSSGIRAYAAGVGVRFMPDGTKAVT